MNKIIWWLPSYVHKIFLNLTGWQLVRCVTKKQGKTYVEYYWTDHWE